MALLIYRDHWSYRNARCFSNHWGSCFSNYLPIDSLNCEDHVAELIARHLNVCAFWRNSNELVYLSLILYTSVKQSLDLHGGRMSILAFQLHIRTVECNWSSPVDELSHHCWSLTAHSDEIKLTQQNKQRNSAKTSQPLMWRSTIHTARCRLIHTHTQTDSLKTTPMFAIAAGK